MTEKKEATIVKVVTCVRDQGCSEKGCHIILLEVF